MLGNDKNFDKSSTDHDEIDHTLGRSTMNIICRLGCGKLPVGNMKHLYIMFRTKSKVPLPIFHISA
jgi:hypothetical protein